MPKTEMPTDGFPTIQVDWIATDGFLTSQPVWTATDGFLTSQPVWTATDQFLTTKLIGFRMINEKQKAPIHWGLQKGDVSMFWEYFMDVSFVWIALIGSIIALLFVYARRTNKRRAR
jgi:hypothetical protein